MAEPDLPDLTSAQKRWAFGAVALFLFAIGLLGFSVNTGVLMPFAIGWVALQIFGYAGALKLAKGDFAHPLFKSQIFLHGIALMLLIVTVTRNAQ